MTPEEDYYQEALLRIKEAEKNKSAELDLRNFESLTRFTSELASSIHFNHSYVSPFSLNLVLSGPLFSINAVRKWAMLSGRTIYFIGPLHVLTRFEEATTRSAPAVGEMLVSRLLYRLRDLPYYHSYEHSNES